MKRLIFNSVLMFAVFAFVFQANAQSTARLQIIHNAADPAAESVDIYLNDDLLLDDFMFRTATPYIDAPANEEITISVAPSSSASVDDAIASFDYNLMAGEAYVAVANGVLDPDQFSTNPDGRSIAFDIYTRDSMRESGMESDQVDFVVFHGATDAPAVDVIARDVAKLVDDAAYSDFTDYISVPANTYLLDVTPGGDNKTIVGTFEADLSGLGGGAAVVFASGFLSPAEGQAAFGLFAALPDGNVVAFPAVTTARLQVIHNAADPAAESVDIYLNDDLLLDDFMFRTATPYIDAPANEEITISVAPSSSASVDDAIASFDYNLMAGEAYVAVANGVLDPTKFLPNPDGKSTAFDIFVRDGAREMATDSNNVDFFVFHGVTDAPTVDVMARRVAELVDALSYGEFSDYISVNPDEYIIDLAPSMDSTKIILTFDGNLSALRGGAAAVFASGFVMPAQNRNGEAFALFAALPNGDVVEFGKITVADVQIIHNAADPAADSVDIYLNNDLAIDNFGFRTATGFIELPANEPIAISVAPGNSQSADDALKTFPLRLLAAENYLVVANGVIDPNQFLSNPNGRDIGFDLFIKEGVMKTTMSEDEVGLLVVHGSTDAPAVDVIARDVGTLVENAAYRDITDYINVPASDYTIDIAASGEGSATIASGDVVASYNADLTGLGGQTAVVFASGFLNPNEDNQNGEDFGLYASTSDGSVVEFSTVTSIEDELTNTVQSYELNQNYPNPFNPSTTISFQLRDRSQVLLKVYNIAGQEVATLVNETYEAGKHEIKFDANALSSGIYFYQIEADAFKATRRMMLVK